MVFQNGFRTYYYIPRKVNQRVDHLTTIGFLRLCIFLGALVTLVLLCWLDITTPLDFFSELLLQLSLASSVFVVLALCIAFSPALFDRDLSRGIRIPQWDLRHLSWMIVFLGGCAIGMGLIWFNTLDRGFYMGIFVTLMAFAPPVPKTNPQPVQK
jgi:hypothetical protein